MRGSLGPFRATEKEIESLFPGRCGLSRSKLASCLNPTRMFSRITLAIIKPDVCAFPPKLAGVKELVTKNGFKVVAEQHRRYTMKEMESFYAEHAGKFFYNRLTTYMSSGPIVVWILHRGEQTITDWRTLLGPTKVFKAIYEAPDSLRGQFGLTDTRNAGHGSDSSDSVRREVKFFFPDLTEGRLQQLLSEIENDHR